MTGTGPQRPFEPSTSAGGSRRPRRIRPVVQGAVTPARVAILALVPLVIFGFMGIGGATTWGAGLLLALTSALVLLGTLLSPGTRKLLAAADGLILPTVGFAATLAMIALSLTALLPGGSHPIWTYVGTDGAASMDLSVTTLELIKLMGLGCLFVIGYLQGARRQDAETTSLLVLGMGGGFCFLTLMAFLSDLGEAGPRFNAELPSANVAGTLFGVMTVLAVAWTVSTGRRFRNPHRSVITDTRLQARLAPGIGLIVLFLGCLVFTASRGAVAATLVALAVFGLWELVAGRLRLGLALSLALLFLLVVVGLALGGNDLLLDRSLPGGPDDGRAAIYKMHWQAFTASPLTGSGLGTFAAINAQYLTAETFPEAWYTQTAHNVYLQWLEEAGLLGSVPMFFTIGAVIVQATIGLDRMRGGRVLVRGLVVANLLILLHGLSDFSLQVPAFASLWAFLLGLQLAWVNARSGR